MKTNMSPNEDSNYQWPDDKVVKGVHPDDKGNPTAVLLAQQMTKRSFISHGP